MNKGTKTIEVSSSALKGELFKRGLNCSDVARDMGRSQKYLSNKLVHETGRINASDAAFLKALYNIDPETYTSPEAVEEPETKDNGELEEIIYRAIMRALREA